MFQLLASLSKSTRTTHRGLSQQFTKDLKELAGHKTGLASMAQKRSERSFLARIARLTTGQLEYIDLFLEAMAEHNENLLGDLVGEYRDYPEELVEMVDFINIEIHRRKIEHRTQLSAVMVPKSSDATEKFSVIYLFSGWSKSGKPRWPRHFCSDGAIR